MGIWSSTVQGNSNCTVKDIAKLHLSFSFIIAYYTHTKPLRRSSSEWQLLVGMFAAIQKNGGSMNDQNQNQDTVQQRRLRLMKTLVYGCSVLGFVLSVGTAGFVVVSNLGMGTVAQVAEMGPGLYAESMQLPKA